MASQAFQMSMVSRGSLERHGGMVPWLDLDRDSNMSPDGLPSGLVLPLLILRTNKRNERSRCFPGNCRSIGHSAGGSPRCTVMSKVGLLWMLLVIADAPLGVSMIRA